jgi:hypothetical protein
MSPRESNAPERASAIREAADRARDLEPHRSDPMLAAVRSAVVGAPALVRTPDGAAAYWLVPFVDGELASGFARVELDERVSQLGAFGAGPRDRSAWPTASFFAEPPSHLLQEIQQRHPDAAIDTPLLTYDRSPAHWGWRVELGSSKGSAFISPGGWHTQTPVSSITDREG